MENKVLLTRLCPPPPPPPGLRLPCALHPGSRALSLARSPALSHPTGSTEPAKPLIGFTAILYAGLGQGHRFGSFFAGETSAVVVLGFLLQPIITLPLVLSGAAVIKTTVHK